jgi:hypothetical protein
MGHHLVQSLQGYIRHVRYPCTLYILLLVMRNCNGQCWQFTSVIKVIANLLFICYCIIKCASVVISSLVLLGLPLLKFLWVMFCSCGLSWGCCHIFLWHSNCAETPSCGSALNWYLVPELKYCPASGLETFTEAADGLLLCARVVCVRVTTRMLSSVRTSLELLRSLGAP